MKLKAYEGSENYIFISYAHKDSDKVLRILDKIAEKGYRIWYDDGIAPGSEWPENIAQHLNGSALVIAFVSNNSIASPNCRREVTFALAKHKPFLGILLEPTTMSPGMELQLSAQQCIMRYNYRSESDFLEKIISCPDLQPCKAVPEPEMIPESQPGSSGPENILAAGTPGKAVKPKKEKPEKKAKPPKNSAPSASRKKLLPILAATAALVLALFLILTAKIEIVPGLKVEKDTYTVTIKDARITAQSIQQINKLKELTSLYISGSAFDPDVLDLLDQPGLITLQISDCTGIGNYTFVNSLPKLHTLHLSGTGITDAQVRTLQLPALWTLNMSGNPGITDLSFASGIESLTSIDFSNCGITAVNEKFLSLSMSEIFLSGNDIADLSGFDYFTVLKKVYLDGNPLTDISWLAKSTESLREVSLADTKLDSGDVAFLADAAGLRKLVLDGIPMTDLEILRNMAELEHIQAQGCGLSDISALKNKDTLKRIYLSGNVIEDLNGLPTPQSENYVRLDLTNNRISSIAHLPAGRYYSLMLQGNPVVYDFTSLDELSGNYLVIDYHESLHRCGSLRDIYNVYVIGVPADQQLELEEILDYTAHFISASELPDVLAKAELD